eukprot:366551-Chlamydomonas_euryale.AAC.19
MIRPTCASSGASAATSAPTHGAAGVGYVCRRTPQLASRSQRASSVSSAVAGRSSGAVLDRPSMGGDIDLVDLDYEYDLLSSGSFDAGFHEYAAATLKMEDLERLNAQAEELLANLEELSSAAETMVSARAMVCAAATRPA